MKRLLAFSLAAIFIGSYLQPAQAGQAEDEAAIRKNAASYAAAYNQRDAKALAALWLPDAVYIDPESGKNIVGRAAIAKYFAEIFSADKNTKLTVDVTSVRFVSTNVAVEQGVSATVGLSKEPVKSNYTAIHVKRDGKWLLDRVTDDVIVPVISHHDKLKDLEWLVGTWIDTEGEETTVEYTCKWTKNQNFLFRTFTISVRDRIDTSGVQLIGWDPTTKKIRSWVFDSSGGFGEGVWRKKGKEWHIVTNDTLPNGQRASSVSIVRQVDRNRFTWQSINRQVAGELLPNVDAVTVVRKSTDE